MPEETSIEAIPAFAGREVRLKGWVRNKRSGKAIHFVILRDGTGEIQCVASKSDLAEADFAAADALTLESSAIIDGVVRADARAPSGYELTVTRVQPVQIADEYPIAKKEHGVDFLMANRHLWIRSARQVAVLKVRDEVIKATRDHFYEKRFVCADAPMFTPNACEGTTTLFEVDYFGDKVYLTQSGQLYNEATAMALGRVFSFGPTFRAEKSKTRRHLAEFWMFEAEAAFCDFEENMRIQEEYIEYLVARILDKCAAQLNTLERDTSKLLNVKAPFHRVTYDECVEALKQDGFDFEWGDDFGSPEETAIAESYDKPVFVTRFPTAIKPFYMKRDPARPEVVLGSDLLAPEGYGEIIGGGQREESIDELLERIEREGLNKDDFAWYLDLRRYGSVPHSGFGLGLERTVSWICGLSHIRSAIPFPRMLYHKYP
jgi:asparaginyl-tRNA synthetase